MATKAELAAELALLRAEYAEREPAPQQRRPDPSPSSDPAPSGDLAAWLAEHGIASEDTTRVIETLTKELEGLTRDKPLLSVGAAFGLGFALGRMSK